MPRATRETPHAGFTAVELNNSRLLDLRQLNRIFSPVFIGTEDDVESSAEQAFPTKSDRKLRIAKANPKPHRRLSIYAGSRC